VASASSQAKAVIFPQTEDQFAKHWHDFKTWLTGRGAEILACETRIQLARFTTPEGVGVVLKNANGRIFANHWSGGAASAWIAYRRNDTAWRVVPRTQELDRSAKGPLLEALIARDGLTCCYCRVSLRNRAISLEHFVAQSCQGPHHMANLALACTDCNEKVGHKPVVEKMRFAQAMTDRARNEHERNAPAAAARLWAWIAERNGVRV
jgi:hypothetical protein